MTDPAPTQPHADRDGEATVAVATILADQRPERYLDAGSYAVAALRALGWVAPSDPITGEEVQAALDVLDRSGWTPPSANFAAPVRAALQAARLAAGKGKQP